jgi:hypothetical protein
MDHGTIHVKRGMIGFLRHMDRVAIRMNRSPNHTDLSAILMDLFATGMDRVRIDTNLCATQ